MPDLLVERDGHSLILTMNRPRAHERALAAPC